MVVAIRGPADMVVINTEKYCAPGYLTGMAINMAYPMQRNTAQNIKKIPRCRFRSLRKAVATVVQKQRTYGGVDMSSEVGTENVPSAAMIEGVKSLVSEIMTETYDPE